MENGFNGFPSGGAGGALAFVSPMSAAGDLILGDTGGAAIRLAKGADSTVLTVDPATHLPLWAAPAGGGGGAMTQLATLAVGGSPVASLTASSIAGTYNHLLLIGTLRTTGTTNPTRLMVQFNADTGNNYDWHAVNFYSTGSINNVGAQAAASITTVSLYEASGINAADGSIFQLTIPNYATTNYNKGLTGHGGEWGESINVFGGSWRNTAAITAIKLFPTANNFAANGIVYLYGIT